MKDCLRYFPDGDLELIGGGITESPSGGLRVYLGLVSTPSFASSASRRSKSLMTFLSVFGFF